MPTTPPVRNAIRVAFSRPPSSRGRRGDPDVRRGGQPHAEVADRGREHRADDEEDGTADALADVVRGQREEQDEDDDDEHAERAELAVEVRRGAFLDRSADLLHLRGALAGGEHLPAQNEADGQGGEGDHRDHTDDDAVVRPELDALGEGGRKHSSSWFSELPGQGTRDGTPGVDTVPAPQVGAAQVGAV